MRRALATDQYFDLRSVRQRAEHEHEVSHCADALPRRRDPAALWVLDDHHPEGKACQESTPLEGKDVVPVRRRSLHENGQRPRDLRDATTPVITVAPKGATVPVSHAFLHLPRQSLHTFAVHE